ncbi:hypothetical protein EDF68_102490 [Ochrobactrum sp. BH3]|nr:hypothetical protein EDF68_102490 [Ochrobactrum sp. BH3]
MTSFEKEIQALEIAFQHCSNALENYILTEAEAEATYDLFCRIGARFGPAISAHLRTVTATDERNFDLQIGPGSNRTDEIRESNAELVGRLLYDLSPAIEGAFHDGERTVHAIIKDLENKDLPLELPKPRQNSRGAGGRPYRELRTTARAKLHDIVIYEAEVQRLSEKEAFNQVLRSYQRPPVGETYWRDLKREQREQRADYTQSVDQIKAAALRNGGTHPQRQILSELPFWELLFS